VPRVLVVGAGIVGLACARALLQDGHAVSLLDRDPDGDKTSWGNAGGIAVTEVVPAAVPGLLWRVPRWLFDPLGPLSVRPVQLPSFAPWLWRFLRAGTEPGMRAAARALAAINRRVYQDIVPLLQDIGLAGDLHRAGALALYESDAGRLRDAAYWALCREFGIECHDVSGAEARALEPALGPRTRSGVLLPEWSHVSDPKRIVMRLSAWLRERQVGMLQGEATQICTDRVITADGRSFPFDAVVIAAGAWSGRLAAGVGDRVLLESERGYNTTLPRSGIALTRQLIFAERSFVATPLEIGLRIGGAAEFAGLSAPPNWRRADALLELALRYLPGLDADGGTRWMGQRPATPDSLPVIGSSPRRANVFYAFGHGHLGLTQATTTGQLIADLVAGRPPPIDIAPYRVDRFA
jgi:D-amino-acid dehydrogenase